MTSNKVVRFRKELESTSSKMKKVVQKQRRKTDIAVDKYCEEHPLTVPDDVRISRMFHDKGEPMHPKMAALFSRGLAENGLKSAKSILYNHILAPSYGMKRREMFTNHSDGTIYGIKDEILDLIDDPFWRSIEERQKFGSYDWDGYKSLIPNINAQYDQPDLDIPDWMEYGIAAAVDELGDGIEPISLEEAIGYCRTDTNSGFPAFTSKPFISMNEDGESYRVLDNEMYDMYTQIAKTVWKGRAHTNLPAILFKRIQPGDGSTSKKRIVECVSRGILWAEARIWRPVLERMRTIDAYSGYMHHSVRMGAVIEESLRRSHVSSLDYSGYDSTIGRYLPLLFRALADKIPSAAPLLEWSAEYYRTCPLMTPHGLIEGEHGLFSGMFGTSFGGSLLNRALALGVEYAINREDPGSLTDVVHLAFGDDTVFAWNGTCDIERIIRCLESAGMVLNIEKQEYCGPCHVDRFVMFQACYWRDHYGFGDHCVPVYSLVRCAARLAFIEYMDTNSKLVYGSGMKVDDIDCPTVVGPIIAALIAKLFEAEHHPNVIDFVSVYAGTWMHYLNPFLCVKDSDIIKILGEDFAYLDFDDAGKFLSHPIAKRLIEMQMYNTKPRYPCTLDGLKESFVEHKAKTSVASKGDKSHFGTALMESLSTSGLSSGMQESILLHMHRSGLNG